MLSKLLSTLRQIDLDTTEYALLKVMLVNSGNERIRFVNVRSLGDYSVERGIWAERRGNGTDFSQQVL
jgi:hypothetical protein